MNIENLLEFVAIASFLEGAKEDEFAAQKIAEMVEWVEKTGVTHKLVEMHFKLENGIAPFNDETAQEMVVKSIEKFKELLIKIEV